MDQLETLRQGLAFKVHTFGCKVNTYDSGLLEGRLARAGIEPLVPMREKLDQTLVHVLNTCAVTSEATQEAVRLARRLKREDPLSVVVVTGCAAQVDTEMFETTPGIDLIVANSHKSQLPELVWQRLRGGSAGRVFKSNIFKKEDLEPGGGIESGHTRAFLKIQDGCNSFCTFCVIPFARGKSRSLSIRALTERVNELVSQGVREVVLTGVHIADYQDGDRVLEDLIEALLAKTLISRLRLTSLEPKEVSDRLLDLFEDERLCRHFHMSIQSADTEILKRMKRKYTAEDVVQSLHAIRKKCPDAFIGMDVIAGFPGETDNEFSQTIQNLRLAPWTRLHVFPYSSRPGTFAQRSMSEHVPSSVIQRRARMLRALSEERFASEAQAQVGTRKAVLGLKSKLALSRDFWNLKVTPALKPNQEALVQVTGVSERALTGHLVLDA